MKILKYVPCLLFAQLHGMFTEKLHEQVSFETFEDRVEQVIEIIKTQKEQEWTECPTFDFSRFNPKTILTHRHS
jgi:hypothetical protein